MCRGESTSRDFNASRNPCYARADKTRRQSGYRQLRTHASGELAQLAASSRHGISVSVQESRDSKRTVKSKEQAEPNAGSGCGNQGRTNGGKMNHIAGGVVRLELGIVRLELKYCERCGGLWQGAIGSTGAPDWRVSAMSRPRVREACRHEDRSER